MPTLTIDLPETAYRAALALPETERVRRVASAREGDEYDDPTLPDYDRPTDEADLEAIARGETIPGDVAFAQLMK